MNSTMETVDYPFIPGKTGIPFVDIFRRIKEGEQEGEVNGSSGRSLFYVSKKYHIGVFDLQSRSLYLSAGYISNDDCIAFDIETRLIPPEKDSEYPLGFHPDMYAKKFIGIAIAYFKQFGCNPVKLRGHWSRNSTNYAQFMKEFDRSHDKVQAAKSTWSGKAFASYGFTEITDSNIVMDSIEAHASLYTVKAYFARPVPNITP